MHWINLRIQRSSHRRRSVKKVFMEVSQNSQENICARDFIKKEFLAQMFSCEFCEISKNTFVTEHLRTTTAENLLQNKIIFPLALTVGLTMNFWFSSSRESLIQSMCRLLLLVLDLTYFFPENIDFKLYFLF